MHACHEKVTGIARPPFAYQFLRSEEKSGPNEWENAYDPGEPSLQTQQLWGMPYLKLEGDKQNCGCRERRIRLAPCADKYRRPPTPTLTRHIGRCTQDRARPPRPTDDECPANAEEPRHADRNQQGEQFQNRWVRFHFRLHFSDELIVIPPRLRWLRTKRERSRHQPVSRPIVRGLPARGAPGEIPPSIPAATSLNARPDSPWRATPPVNACQRRTITSQYFGSSSITRACRPVFSQAITVVPLPANGSRIVSRDLLLFRSARATNSTGFIVGCSWLAAGRLICQASPWFRSPHQKRSLPSRQPHRIGSYWRR